MSNKVFHQDLHNRLLAAIASVGIELTESHRTMLLSNGQFTDDGTAILYDYPNGLRSLFVTIVIASQRVVIDYNPAHGGESKIDLSSSQFNEWMRRDV